MFQKHLVVSTQTLWAVGLFAAVLHAFYFFFIAPHVMNQDEAALLLNARFLMEAGSDEWGSVWPVVFRSFGDAKLPGFIYLVALFGKIMGFSIWAVRFPSFVVSLILPFMAMHLSLKLTGSRKAAFFTGIFLALSPWTYHYGTVGFEAHVALAWFLGAVSLWWSENEHWSTDLLALMCAVIAGSTYNAPFLLLPFIGLALCISRWPRKGKVLQGLLTTIVAFSLVFFATFGATTQKQGIAFFQDATILAQYPEYRASFEGIFQKLLGNQWVYFFRIGGEHFLSSFSWEFLVMRGGQNPWHAIPYTGHVSFLVPLLAFVGIGAGVKTLIQGTRESRKKGAVLFLLLAASLAPATITTDAPHATRSLFFFVLLSLFGALGANAFWSSLRSYQYGSALLRGSFLMLLFASLAVWMLPAHQNWETGIDSHWYAGLEEALSRPEVRSAAAVFVIDPEGVLYTRVANEERMTFSEFQETVQRSEPATTGLVRVEKLGKYSFIFQPTDAQSPGVILQQRGKWEWDTITL